MGGRTLGVGEMDGLLWWIDAAHESSQGASCRDLEGATWGLPKPGFDEAVWPAKQH